MKSYETSLLVGIGNAAHGETAPTSVADSQEQPAIAEVEVVRVGTTARRTRPIVPVAARKAGRAFGVEPGSWPGDTIRSQCTTGKGWVR